MKTVGIMTGTSCDGIDISFCGFSDNKFEKYFFETIEYEELILQQIKKVLNQQATLAELCDLNYQLAHTYIDAINQAFALHKIDTKEIELIAIHGQTIWHNDHVSTLQIGEPSIISEYFKLPVVNDFRSADIATKNNGAPLIYLFDKYLFADNDQNIITLNIGGIANIASILNPHIAFDTGPGNMIIDGLMQHFYHQKYDNDGLVAASGNIIEQLLTEQLSNKYYQQPFPKTTGREQFGNQFIQSILKLDYQPQDLIATFTYLTARTIADSINSAIEVKPINKLIISGGGAYNSTLINHLQSLLPMYELEKLDNYGVSVDEKEALAFGYFGYMRYTNQKLQLLNGVKAYLGKVTEVY